MTTTPKPARTRRTTVPDVTIEGGTSVVEALAESPRAATPEFLLVAPADLTVDEDANVRKDLHLSDNTEFVDSVRELGVLQPVVAYPDPLYDGKYRVLRGHRRTVAAQIVGSTAVPVWIVPSPADADRVAGQLAENIHRTQMSEAEQVDAVKQLHLFGLPVEEIVKKTARPRTVIDAALNVAASNTAVELLQARPEITLVQAAQLLEFEDDPDLYAELIEEASDRPHQIDHIVQNARSDRELEAARVARRAELQEQGIHVFADDESKTGWTDQDDIYVNQMSLRRDVLLDTLLPDRAGDIGALIRSYWDASTDPRKAGVEWYVRTAAIDTIDGWERRTNSGAPRGQKTEAEKEQARKDRTDKQLWLDATTVRRQFISTLVTATKPPKGWEIIVAHHLAGALEGKQEYGALDLAMEWLNINPAASDWRTIDGHSVFYRAEELWIHQHPNKAPQYALAKALAGFEKHLETIDVQTKPWRAQKPNVGPYLGWLTVRGYHPAQIEIDVIDADVKRARKAKLGAATEDAA